MSTDSRKNLTYVLANGYEKTIILNVDKLREFASWYHDADSKNSIELPAGINERITLFKDTILSIRY